MAAFPVTGPDRAETGPTRLDIATIAVARTALWQDARLICDEALRRGLAFVALLRTGNSPAEEHLLADMDLQRANRYRQAEDRQQFVLGRTVVHHLVRPSGASAPYVLSFGVHGKPFLHGRPAFNLSHSAGWVACVVSPGEAVGIDVEAFLRLGDYRELLAATTHPAERRIIGEAAPSRRLALFKRCWTRKEAMLKASGKGLSDDLCSIDVCLAESQPLVGDSALLRLVDLPADEDQLSVSVALDVSVSGLVVMHVARHLQLEISPGHPS